MDATLTDPLLGALLDQRYRIRGRIARGGMASVYEAVDERLERVVAVKVMHSPYAEDPSFVDRFIREARSAAALSHPHIVAVFDQGRDRDVTYLVMEKVDGHTLREVLTQRGRVSPAEAVSIVEPVLEALATAHHKGLIHRDVKPENVLISPSGMVKVADFGLARAVEASNRNNTTKGVVMGTVAYVSPEQIATGETDQRSDVYAAGIMLYELLTGSAPFVGQSAVNVAFQHVHADVPPPSASAPDIPVALDNLVVRVTRRDRSARPADAGVFLQALRDVRNQVGFAPVPLAAAGIAGATNLVSSPPQNPYGSPTALTPQSGPPAHEPATALMSSAGPTSDAGPTHLMPGQPRHQHYPLDQQMPPQPPEGGLLSTGNLFTTGRHAARRNKTGTIMVGAAGLLVVVMIIAICGWWASGDDYVTAPNLVGLSKQGAESKAKSEKLDVKYSAEEYSDTIPKGMVIKQRPSANGKVEEGGTITLVVSKGPASQKVPSVSGLDQAQATTLLETNTFSVTVTKEKSDDVEAGLAVRTEPEAGAAVKRGSPITLVISDGAPPVAVPDVRGQTQAAAQQILETAGFVVEITLQKVVTPAAGTVITQTPAPTTQAPKGSTVTLTVAESLLGSDPTPPTGDPGAATIRVPNVDGKRWDEARAILEQAGLRAKKHLRGSGKVFRQSPKAGSMAKPGQVVEVWMI